MSDSDSVPTSAGVETFDIALVAGTLVSLAATYALIRWGGLSGLLPIVGVITIDAVVVFLFLPHAVAYWLRCDLGLLLEGETR
jgi:hypothetical protein